MNNISSEGKKEPNKAILIFGFFVSFLYLLIGFLIFLKPSFLQEYSPTIRMALGFALVAYGIFRAYRTYKMNFRRDEEV